MAKTKRKPTKRKSPAKNGGRGRNVRPDRTLSSDPVTKNGMRKRTKRTPKDRAPAGIDRVIAECAKVDAALDKVAAALIELERTGHDQVMPPLTIREVATGDGLAGETRGWAVVSGDPQIPLTEKQAREIVAAMQTLGTLASIGIAAE